MDRESLNYVTRTVLQAMVDAERAAELALGPLDRVAATAASARCSSLETSILKLSL